MKIGTFINHGTMIEITGNQTVNLSVDKGQVRIGDRDVEDFIPSAAPDGKAEEKLLTPEAKELHAKLQTAGVLDEHWKPVGLSFAEKGTLIEYMAEKLDIRAKWKFFGALWNVDAETLRTSKTRGLEQEKTWAFRSRLEAL